jgi:4-hydroxybenzoate polyprenyltransferase
MTGMPNTVLALALTTHPGPTLTVATIGVVLGAGVGLDPGRLALLGLALAANQASVGMSNDGIDSERDRAVGRTDKPVALGWVPVRLAMASAFIAAGISVLLTLPLGPGAVAANAVFLVAGWAYNAWLKSSALSVVPYVLGFGALPLLVTLALPSSAVAAWWATAAAAALGIAAHFANVLPDLDDDDRTGVRGLPHRLGRRAAGITTYSVLAVASTLVVFGSGANSGAVGWIGFGLTLCIAVAGIVLVLTRPPTRLLFQLILAAALVNVVLLALSGSRMVA